jgi:hypothetical protein
VRTEARPRKQTVPNNSTLKPRELDAPAVVELTVPRCRSCDTALARTFADLGEMPLANAYLSADQMAAGTERRWSLHVRVCDQCLLVQVNHVVTPHELFADYAYFSSYSSSWLMHCERFAESATDRLALRAGTGNALAGAAGFSGSRASTVVEIASNDGYLLQFFRRRGITVLGVEPAANVAAVAIDRGIPTEVAFFSAQCARRIVDRDGPADLVVGNNVLAHVPDLHDVLDGLRILIGEHGVASIEVPHLLELIRHLQFDTIYHEHFSYFSLLALVPLLHRHDLTLFDVEQIPTHGGSIRLWIAAENHAPWDGSDNVANVVALERLHGLDHPSRYDRFAADVTNLVDNFVDYFHHQQCRERRIAAYGAAAKGNTFLNTCGLNSEDIDFVADLSPVKQGHFLPGSHIPVVHPDRINIERPDLVLILPWNLRTEVMAQLQEVPSWGGKFVTAVPNVEVLP